MSEMKGSEGARNTLMHRNFFNMGRDSNKTQSPTN